MVRLGDNIGLLTALRRQTQAALAATRQDAGRMAEVADFGPNPGDLRMLTYAPRSLQAGAPLVVVLHGCAQRAEAYAEQAGWLALADRLGFAVLAPEQAATNSPNRCFNWFEPGDTARGQGEVASIRAMMRHAVKLHRLDANRVYVTGLSAGGAMALAMLATYPEAFAGGAVVAGLPFGVAETLPQALQAMFGGRAHSSAELGALVRKAAPRARKAPRLSIWHGDADRTVRSENAAHIARQWAAAHNLTEAPSDVQDLPGRTRSVWRSALGEEVLETHVLDGLGHGTPLETAGEAGLGAVGPYLLEAGVSSTLETARFWGLAEAAAPAPRRRAPPRAATPGPRGGVPDVSRVITDALRVAGLLK